MTEFNLDIFKMGHFILYRHGKGFIGDAIARAQRKRGFSIDDSMYTHIDVSGGGPFAARVNPPMGGKVNITEYYRGVYVKVVKFKDDNYDVKRYKVAFEAATKLNIIYDFMGVFRFVFPWIPNPKSFRFCSENALESLQSQYTDALGIKPKDCMPAHFLNTQHFELVWEGVIPK
ncbi:MAG: hypothetical protein HC880_00455 [Bacteroidia bacterium]|nr:hypothetical protein [Bacteroidia bacterium]